MLLCFAPGGYSVHAKPVKANKSRASCRAAFFPLRRARAMNWVMRPRFHWVMVIIKLRRAELSLERPPSARLGGC